MHTEYGADIELPKHGPAQIGPLRICANGLHGGQHRYDAMELTPDADRTPVSRTQVEIAKEFMRPCRRTRWARDMQSPTATQLKHWIESCGKPHISTGAVIVAALELGLVCAPAGTRPHTRDALIGIHFDDVATRMAEHGWHLTRNTFGRIKEPEPAHFNDHVLWYGMHKIGIMRPTKNTTFDAVEMLGGAATDSHDVPPHVWQEIADALGISDLSEH